jgi:hypothetical protein
MSGPKQLPRWNERQKILHSKDKKGTPQQLTAWGEKALSEKLFQDALEYFKAADHREGLEKLKSIALQEGDSFLLVALERAGLPISEEIWNRAGEKAMELGKIRFAKTAFERAKNEPMVARVTAAETHDSGPANVTGSTPA